MRQTDSCFEEVIVQFRHMLPTDTGTAQAIDRHEPREHIVKQAIDDGYIENADEFVQFVEVCVRRGK